MWKRRKVLIGFCRMLIFLFCVGVFVGVVTYLWTGKDVTHKLTIPLTKESQISITPTPFPFAEVTIPYLRAKKYESTLGDRTRHQVLRSYSSYVTSYTSEGLKVNGLLTIPHGTKPESGWPAIVFVHGYIPPTLYETTQRYTDYVDYLARNGFVVFKIDLRGHGDSEGEHGGGYYSSDYVIDTLNAYSALQNADFVNKNAIGLWGHSMAGNVISRAWAAKPEIPAVVIWAGAGYTYQDLVDYRLNDRSYRPPNSDSAPRKKRDELFKTHGTFNETSEFWKQVPFTNYLNDLKGAIEIHHAKDDTVVSIEYSRNLMKLLDATSVSHQLYEYPSGGHNLTGASFGKAMQRTVEFFQERL